MAGSNETKRQRFLKFLSSAPYYAACESGHVFWSGPDRNTFSEAKADAKKHDDDAHNGEETAVVLDT